MIRERIEIWQNGEYAYKTAGNFRPFMMAMLHEDEEAHPAMIILPGGAYVILTAAEAEYPARKFYELGYNAFVLCYTNNITNDAPVHFQPLRDVSRAVRLIRGGAERFRLEDDSVYVCGFSAGGHLAAALAVHYNLPQLCDSMYTQSNKPNAVLVNYPIVCGGVDTIKMNYASVLGEHPDKEEYGLMCLDENVRSDSSPMFISHGTDDRVVPAIHSLKLATACAEHGVPYELHLLCDGGHGVTNQGATASDTKASDYVYEQLYETVKAIPSGQRDKYPLFADLHPEKPFAEFTADINGGLVLRMFIDALRYDQADVMRVLQKISVCRTAEGWHSRADIWMKQISEKRSSL